MNRFSVYFPVVARWILTPSIAIVTFMTRLSGCWGFLLKCRRLLSRCSERLVSSSSFFFSFFGFPSTERCTDVVSGSRQLCCVIWQAVAFRLGLNSRWNRTWDVTILFSSSRWDIVDRRHSFLPRRLRVVTTCKMSPYVDLFWQRLAYRWTDTRLADRFALSDSRIGVSFW